MDMPRTIPFMKAALLWLWRAWPFLAILGLFALQLILSQLPFGTELNRAIVLSAKIAGATVALSTAGSFPLLFRIHHLLKASEEPSSLKPPRPEATAPKIDFAASWEGRSRFEGLTDPFLEGVPDDFEKELESLNLKGLKIHLFGLLLLLYGFLADPLL